MVARPYQFEMGQGCCDIGEAAVDGRLRLAPREGLCYNTEPETRVKTEIGMAGARPLVTETGGGSGRAVHL